jgi:hypothetical protein
MHRDDSELEHRRQAAKAAREWAKGAHPFDRSQALDAEQDVYDDESSASAVLVALPGAADRLWISAVDFFDETTDWQLRRMYLRRLAPMVEHPHRLGSTVTEVAASLRRLTRGHSRTVFFGTSLGGFHALLLGTLAGADAILVVNPVTSMERGVLDAAGDHRWDLALAHTTEAWLDHYGDIPRLWQRYAPPVTVLHYPYRDKIYCVQAEHMADQSNVTAIPHYEYSPMDKLKNSGELRRILASLLWPDADPPRRIG